MHRHTAEPGIHQQVPDHHKTAAIEAVVQRALCGQPYQHGGMIGEFEVMIGHQQDATVVLHVDAAGLGAWYARR